MTLLSENGLNAENIRRQGYDGAANMSASYKGLQARIQSQNEKALYVHCHAHCLNQVLVETAKSSLYFVRFFNFVERLYTFLSSSSKRHAAFIEMQKLLYAGEKTWELKRLTDTCWACRENALKALQKVFSAVMQLLKKMSDSNPPDPAAGDALMLFRSINFEFMLCLELATPVFQETAVASAALPRKDVDLAVSYTVVEGVLKMLQELRTESKFKIVFEKAKEKAEAAGIAFPDKIPGETRPRKIPTRYKYSSKSTGEDHYPENLEEFYRTRVYYTFLRDGQEMVRRFKGKDNSSTGIILKGLHSLTVASKWSKGVEPGDVELVRTVSKFYGIEEEKIFTELKVFHASYSFPKSTVQEMLKCLKDNEIESVFSSFLNSLKYMQHYLSPHLQLNGHFQS